MFIYIAIIGFITTHILLIGSLLPDDIYNYSILHTLLLVFLSIVLVTIIDAIVALLVNKLPKKWFNHTYKRFHIFKFEKKFYNSIKIQKWKDSIPELGKLANFRKNKVENPNDNNYILLFLEQCCIGEIVHIVSMFLGFLIVFIDLDNALLIGVPVALGNAIINSLSLMILRYNRPRLEVVYKRNKRKELRSEHE